MATGWEPIAGGQPLAPLNGQATSPFIQGVLDLRWDDPKLLSGNTPFVVVGVNIYRSDVSDRGPYFRINEFPVGGGFYRDRTDNVLISKEVVDWNTAWQFKANAPNDRRWVFKTKHTIVKKEPNAPFQTVTAANSPSDVTVYIDGVEVSVEDVFGPSGEVTLVNQGVFNQATEKYEQAILPDVNAVVEVSYYANRNHVRTGLGTVLHYRLTTVVVDTTTPSGYTETDLRFCQPVTPMAIETLDYIWREAIRRNHWILQQGGERVKVFIRKMSGVICTCKLDVRTREYSNQPSNRCTTCYGTGYVGGYEGPYDCLVAPDDAEQRISQTPNGRRKEHTYEVWTVPSPIVTMRDFVVKQNNERYSIGAVRRPTNRGNILQQHFNIAYLDESDIRYRVPIDGTTGYVWPQTRYGNPYMPPVPTDGSQPIAPPYSNGPNPNTNPYPEGPDAQLPMGTDKAGWPSEKQPRGRTPVWDNQNK